MTFLQKISFVEVSCLKGGSCLKGEVRAVCRFWVFGGNGLFGHRLIDSCWFEKNPPTESIWKRRSKENAHVLASVGNLWRSSGVWRRFSERPIWFRCTGWHYDQKGSSLSATSRKTSFWSKLIAERWRDEHQLQFPMYMALTIVHYTCTAAS